MPKRVRSFSAEQKLSIVKRLLNGERSADLARELKIRRTHLYKWKDVYRRYGPEGFLRRRGRPLQSAAGAAAAEGGDLAAAKRRIAELERKVGQQQMDIDFFRQALRQVGVEQNSVSGAKPSTRSSKR